MRRLCLLIVSLPLIVHANNVQLSDLKLINSTDLQVQLSWDNSWRSESGYFHDALWLFALYRTDGMQWQPLDFLADTNVQSLAGMLERQGVSDGRGMWIRRATEGAGNIPPTLLNIPLSMALEGENYECSLFAIEMTYVAEGGFWLGDSAGFHHYRDPLNGSPFRVDSEAAIAHSQISVGAEAEIAGDIPASYPKGYSAFYAMKYELSQIQYRDFLNHLNYSQQSERSHAIPSATAGTYALALSAANPRRNGLVIQMSGQMPDQAAMYGCDASADGLLDQADDGQNRACNYLNWQDLLAYLDWAGLRPMTEWEFEKACRGPEYPIPGEFAWGTAHAIDANSLLHDGLENEQVSEVASHVAGLASHGYAGPDGPLRCGFGGNDSSDRLQMGAGYFGQMEMSGNLWELCIGVDSSSLAFDGQHGDGQLSEDGNANVAGWPLQSGGIHRGGALNSGIVGEFRDLAVSDRFYYNLHPGARRHTSGGRGVRNAHVHFAPTSADNLPFTGGIGDGYAFAQTSGQSLSIEPFGQTDWEISIQHQAEQSLLVLRISSNHGNISSIQIFNLLGQQVDQKILNRHQKTTIIDISRLRPGAYFVQLDTISGIARKSFIR